MASSSPAKFRAIGFCGADDSVDPRRLIQIAVTYPLVEFGVLFRPDKEGLPRYASYEWVEQLVLCRGEQHNMKLAAHLCGVRVNDVLSAADAGIQFLHQLENWGFGRIQINATQVNGVDTSHLADCVAKFTQVACNFPKLEFIIQKNEETRPLWEGLLNDIPSNVSMLVDESKGTGILAKSWPSPPLDYEIGYAGGIGPANVETVMKDIQQVAAGRSVWIDMESSLRSIDDQGKDIFDLDKCQQVIDVVKALGIL